MNTTSKSGKNRGKRNRFSKESAESTPKDEAQYPPQRRESLVKTNKKEDVKKTGPRKGDTGGGEFLKGKSHNVRSVS